MIHIHQLDGCAPAPLAHYLKALGILRLVSEQADGAARGWWQGVHFMLATKLTEEELEAFFLYDYQPTPLVSPWNKGAGFFFAQDPSLAPLEASTSRRFAMFRSGIAASRSQLNALSNADQEVRNIKAETKVPGMSNAERIRIRGSDDYKMRLREAQKRFDLLKANQIPNFRLNWRGAHREWMDVAVVLEDDGRPKYPALLGTGGNDGRLDFTNNFMKRIGEMFDLDTADGKPRPAAKSWVSSALWNLPVPGNLSGQPVGQYLPGTAGGANNSNGPDADSVVNPMDFILMLEGSLAFASHVSRRFGSSASSRPASPFVVNACGAAYASASVNDESARGEQWMPLWSRPSSYRELRRLFAEGRAQVYTRNAQEPLELAQAVRRLGTARGIRAFQRYGYIERNGKSNLAVPLGRFDVMDRCPEHLNCIDDLNVWLRRLRREARSRNASARLTMVEKCLVEALFSVTLSPQSPERWQQVLFHLARVEGAMAHGNGFAAQPIPRLRPEWVAACDDDSPESRLALAFALQATAFRKTQQTPIDSIRRHWLPLDRRQPWRFATTGAGSAGRLDVQPDVVMHGRHGLTDAVALVERRLVEASQAEGRYLPLRAAPRAAANIADLTALLGGNVDLDRTLTLGCTLMALDRHAWAKQQIPIKQPHAQDWPDDAWMAIRLCTLPWPVRTPSGFELDIGAEPALIRRLAAGDAASAVAIALRRLHAAGVRCTIRTATATRDAAKLWAAALAFPITNGTATRFLRRLDPSKE